MGEMDKFLETYNLPILNQEAAENLTRWITSSEFEAVIKTLLTHKNPDQMASQVNLPNIQRRINTYPSQTIPKNSRRGKALKLFLQV